MKTLTKKCVIVTAMAVLLVLTAMLTGCSNGIAEKEGYKPPAGMGAVRLNFNRTIQRSILPEGVTFDDFEMFDLYFEDMVGTNDQNFTGANAIAKANISNPIPLEPGTYDLTIIAYIDALGADAVATATEPGLVINPGVLNTPAKITLKAYDPPSVTGTGTFKWIITTSTTITSTITQADMIITEVGNSSHTETVDLKSNWEGSLDTLTAGYYYVDFVFVRNNNVTMQFRHILHIYQNLTSTFTYVFTDDYFAVTRGKLTLDLDPITDLVPELEDQADPGEALVENQKLTVSLSAADGIPDEIVLEVTNAASYDDIEWYYGEILLGNVSTFTVDATTPFNKPGLYNLTVIATKDDVPYATFIRIEVID